MAGLLAQSANQFWTALTPAAGVATVYEFVTGQCYFATVVINVDLDASATAGVTLHIYEKTGASGTKAVRSRISADLSSDPDGISIELPPGAYSIEALNDDATYPVVSLNGWSILRT